MPYPTVDRQFIVDKIINSGSVIVESELSIGSTTTFVLTGDKPLHKRFVTVRAIDGQINFMQATAHAIMFGFMRDLLDWYRDNRGWNEGAFVA